MGCHYLKDLTRIVFQIRLETGPKKLIYFYSIKLPMFAYFCKKILKIKAVKKQIIVVM